MTVFISGGCKNGKSAHAERIAAALAADARPLYYVATMRPGDGEDEARITRHRASRAGMGFTTVETPSDITSLAERCDMNGTFLLDSLTALLANEMFLPDGSVYAEAHYKIAAELEGLVRAARHLVVVSDFIYADADAYDVLTEAYRRALAWIDRRCAALCDAVLEACCGSLTAYKGREALGGVYEKVL